MCSIFLLFKGYKTMNSNEINATANGTAIHNRYGRYLPHLVDVLSATIPIKGSDTASHIRLTSIKRVASPTALNVLIYQLIQTLDTFTCRKSIRSCIKTVIGQTFNS